MSTFSPWTMCTSHVQDYQGELHDRKDPTVIVPDAHEVYLAGCYLRVGVMSLLLHHHVSDSLPLILSMFR